MNRFVLTAILPLLLMVLFACGSSSNHSTSIECGNNKAEGPEVCDGNDLKGRTCTDIDSNFIGGTLSCTLGCASYDTSGCITQETDMLIITINPTPQNGSITITEGIGPHDFGSTVNVTAVADNGYQFVGWDGALSGNNNPATLHIENTKTITAKFVEQPTGTLIEVNQDGSGDYDNIQDAANVAQPGDIIYIHYGVYNEKVITTISGTEDKPIMYYGDPNGDVIIDAENATRGYCIVINKTSNLVFKNIKLKGANWKGIDLQGPLSNIILDNLEVSYNIHNDENKAWSYGIMLTGTSGLVENITISNCNIHDNAGHGLYILDAVQNVKIDNCLIHNNGSLAEDNILIASWDSSENGPNKIEISNSEISYSSRQGILAWKAKNIWIHDCWLHHNGATGIQIEDGVENFVIENNLTENNQQFYSTETGIWVDDAKYGVVRNNTIRHNQVGIKVSKSENIIVRHNNVYKNHRYGQNHKESGGIALLAYDGINNTNIMVIHNTLYDIGNPTEGYSNVMIEYFDMQDSLIQNSIFYNNISAQTTAGYQVKIRTESNTTDFQSDYNLFYDDEPLVINQLYQVYSLDEYITNNHQDIHSVQQKPNFKNPEENNFTLLESSPCIDSGRFLTQTNNTGSGNTILVKNSLFFNDGYGLTTGDTIKIGVNELVIITNVDYEKHEVEINKNISWEANENVAFPYFGTSPDIGCYEYSDNL